MKTAATDPVTVTTGPKIPPRLRVLFLILLGTLPIAWLAAWGSEAQKRVVGEPDVVIAAPDNKPVISLQYDPANPGILLLSAGDDAPGGGVVLWESTDKANADLPTRDAGAFGKVPFRRSRTLRVYGKGGGSPALYSPDGKYLATWSSGKLTVWKNTAYFSVPLWNREISKIPRFVWDDSWLAWESVTSGKPHVNLFAPSSNKVSVSKYTDILPEARITTNLPLPRDVINHLTVSALSADGKQIAVADEEGWVYRFWVSHGDGTAYYKPSHRARFGHAQNPGVGAPKVTALAFSPDGKTLATGGTDGMVFLWRL